ncbi:MAG: DUF5916 domain-containing protein [Gemmatimonadales bacterium]
MLGSIAPLLALLGTQSQLAQTVIPGRGAPSVSIPRIEATITVDGELDEAPWSRAVRLTGFSQYQPVDSRPAEEQTEVLVWYAPDAIHFGILAHDRRPGAIRATVADRDNIESDDHVIIYLDTFNDHRRAFMFGVNPLGVQQDGVRSEGAQAVTSLTIGSVDLNPDYYFESRGRITEQGYTVEVRIPFKSLRYPGKGPQRWGLNLVRRVQRTGYEDTWTDVKRANASFLAQSGTIEGLHDLRRGLVIEAQPFVTATANGVLDGASQDFSRENLDPSAGVNVRLGLTNLSLDATLNPDFSQVESDAGQVTVNERFALFFPEKRPFFLEGIELFATPNQLVYTRQIVDPIIGGKITGKFGALGVAHLSVLDNTAGKDALFNVSRLRRDFGSNSIAGLTFTDRHEGTDYNRVLAGDLRVVFAKLYFVEAQLGSSWTRDALGSRSGAIWELELDRTGRSWGFNYALEGFGDDFQSRSGFVNRSGIVQAHVFNRLTWYGGRGALLENFTTFFGPRRIWRYGGFGSESAIEGLEEIDLNFRLRGGWEINPHVSRDFVGFDPADYAGYETEAGGVRQRYRPAEGASGIGYSLRVATPTFETLDAEALVARSSAGLFEEGAEGRMIRLNAGISLRPSNSIRLEASALLAWLERERDGSEFARTIIPRLKIEYQPIRSLFFRAIGEYRAQRTAALRDARTGAPLLVAGTPVQAAKFSSLRVDGLVALEPSPGSVAFFGYGSFLESDDRFAFSDLRRTSDGFFVKLAYQIRR